jgi:hypothetical protein
VIRQDSSRIFIINFLHLKDISVQLRAGYSVALRGLTFFVLIINSHCLAQIGGRQSFNFLNVPTSARLAGLGGINVSLADRDVNFFYANPALAGDTLAGTASANYQFFFADIGHAAFTYAHDFKSVGVITMGVQHLNYGTIKGYDAAGAEIGEFKAQETALVLGKTHQVNYFRLGASLKGVFSNLAGFHATAIAIDLGGIFIHPEKELTVGLAAKNFGVVLSDYSSTKSHLPFDVQAGTTFKPQHMPLRFSITLHHIAARNIFYDNPAVDSDNVKSLGKVLSRVNFASEILLHKNVNILVGYNFMNHLALKLDNGGGGAGLTFGFAANVRKFDFVFSRMGYVAGKAAYCFTLSSRINSLFKRRLPS